jgi:hypothetical protein
MAPEWLALRACDFCGSDAVALAPQVGTSEYDAQWVPICVDHLMMWWEGVPREKRLPAFLLPSVPENATEYPVYDVRPVRRGWWQRIRRLWI